MKDNTVLPKDLVTMILEIMPRLDLIDLNRLLLFAEMEVNHRECKGFLDDETN